MASLFTFGKFVYVQKFYKMFICFSVMTSIKNYFCAFLASVKTYTHTKNCTCTFTGSHLRAVTDADNNDNNDSDNAGCHSTITGVI